MSSRDGSAKCAILRERARIVSAIRSFFDGEDFVEVSTDVRIAAPAPEEYIDCPAVVGGGFLRASPELQMKKLLAMGMDKIYQIGPCFRDGEKGSRHNPEFTMLEWYRKQADYRDIAKDMKRLLKTLGFDTERFKEILVRDVYLKIAQWDPWQKWDRDRFDFDMATKIEPYIKELGGGVFLFDYPPQAASLAKVSEEGVAERWELYFNGMELANAFSELCDKDEQLRRFEESRKMRKLLKEADYPIDYEFIECISQIEKAAGVALGVDRLLMIILNFAEILTVRA